MSLPAPLPQPCQPVYPASKEGAKGCLVAEFLMPKKLLAREAHKYSLKVLAHRYLVSMQAMEIRLKDLVLVCIL